MARRGCPMGCGLEVIVLRNGVDEDDELILQVEPVSPVLAGTRDVWAVHLAGGLRAWTLHHLVRLLQVRRQITEQQARDVIADDYAWHRAHTCPTRPATERSAA